jgi:hypothetical protein
MVNRDITLLTDGNYLELFESTRTVLVTVQKLQRVALEVHMDHNGLYSKNLQYW